MSKPAILIDFGKGGWLSCPAPPLCHPSTWMNVDWLIVKRISGEGRRGVHSKEKENPTFVYDF